jgi:hypothetical protein
MRKNQGDHMEWDQDSTGLLKTPTGKEKFIF